MTSTSDDKQQQWLDRSRAEWNARAPMFDEMSARNAAGDDRKAEIDFIARALDLHPGSRVLDAGCGPGHFAIAFAERGCVVDGIDIAPDMIERARANAELAGVSIAFTVGDLASLSAPDATYDAIVARMALQFAPRLSAVLDEFERVATPGARFWLSVPGALAPMYAESWKRFIDPEPRSVNYIVPWELIQVLESRGWRLLDQWGSFDNVPTGDNVTASAQIDIHALPPSLQQAAATVWNIIATRSAP